MIRYFFATSNFVPDTVTDCTPGRTSTGAEMASDAVAAGADMSASCHHIEESKQRAHAVVTARAIRHTKHESDAVTAAHAHARNSQNNDYARQSPTTAIGAPTSGPRAASTVAALTNCVLQRTGGGSDVRCSHRHPRQRTQQVPHEAHTPTLGREVPYSAGLCPRCHVCGLALGLSPPLLQ